MTRQVDALEEHLGTILLNRSTRRVSLTPAGEAYYVQAARILSDLEEANRSVSELSGPPRGLLRVTLPVAFARLHVAPIVSEFLKSCPEIELELLMTDNVVNLVEDRIDMAIRIGSLKSSSLVARKLAHHRRVVCASHEYLEKQGEPGVPTDLAKHNCLTFSYSTGDRTWRFARAGQDEQVRVRGNLRTNHSETLREAALAGLGLILMPTWLIGSDLAAGRLKPVLMDWQANVGRQSSTAHQDGGIYAVYLADRRARGRSMPSPNSYPRNLDRRLIRTGTRARPGPGRSKHDSGRRPGLAGGQRDRLTTLRLERHASGMCRASAVAGQLDAGARS
jgi:DNA-binding transcriptional LysR family regulator